MSTITLSLLCRLSQDRSSGDVTLSIERSVISDSGVYAVHVGHVTSHLRVGVASQRPVFIEELRDQTITPGRRHKKPLLR